MPAAQNKADLAAITTKEFEKLNTLLDLIPADRAMEPVEDDTSIKDVIGHRAHWIDLFFGWYEDGQAGRAVFFPAEGYKWNDLKRYNADLRARQADLDWPGAVALLRNNHKRLRAFIETRSEAELYDGPLKGSNNKWRLGRWVEATGPSHYRSASKFIRKAVRENALT
ncbi:ClbS/DfsB family four-helix bundle protein [Tateyamaria omphalii]|uniref:ClbS/DfsB family four-helix bundle protein n=1 Tax=Tateyamaria omphalii TaxID=299262 RepID=UPI001C99665E|nr:ClbS/DfsB family four-helix bundle protein [Tateyamaria omphalii]MBY5933792.1 ClbS/DfsB family four-helix bundle protein [Tateyamaria omphalii]